MTTTEHTSSAAGPDGLDRGVDAADPRVALAKAVALAGTVIGAVRPDQLVNPTPCDAFDVRALLGHLVFALDRIARVGRGEDVSVPPSTIVSEVADDRWLDAWTTNAHEVQRAWSDASLLQKIVTLPFAQLPGAVALGIYTSEVTVHTWDLATATGQRPAWDDGVVAAALAVMEEALPAAPRGEPIPFGSPVAIPASAPLIARLAAWTGRDPGM